MQHWIVASGKKEYPKHPLAPSLKEPCKQGVWLEEAALSSLHCHDNQKFKIKIEIMENNPLVLFMQDIIMNDCSNG